MKMKFSFTGMARCFTHRHSYFILITSPKYLVLIIPSGSSCNTTAQNRPSQHHRCSPLNPMIVENLILRRRRSMNTSPFDVVLERLANQEPEASMPPKPAWDSKVKCLVNQIDQERNNGMNLADIDLMLTKKKRKVDE